MHELMDTFLVGREEIPEGSGVLQIGLRVTLLGVNKGGKLDTVADKEHRRIVANHIPIALFCVELEGKSAGIASRVRRAFFSSHSREAYADWGLFANVAEEICGALVPVSKSCISKVQHLCGQGPKTYDVGDIMGDFKFSESGGTLGMNDTLRNTLAIKVSEQIDQVEVLEQNWAVTPQPLRRGGKGHRATIGGRVDLRGGVCTRCHDSSVFDGSEGIL
jgi:hypothetical protein